MSKQKACEWSTYKAQKNMNTELTPEITRTWSKGHARLQIITVYRLGRNNIRLQCLELSNNMLQEDIMGNKGMAC